MKWAKWERRWSVYECRNWREVDCSEFCVYGMRLVEDDVCSRRISGLKCVELTSSGEEGAASVIQAVKGSSNSDDGGERIQTYL